MASSSDGNDFKPKKVSEIVSGMFQRTPNPRDAAPSDPNKVMSPAERRVAMRSLDAVEVKWSKAGLVLSAIFAFFLPIYASKFLHTAKEKSLGSTDEAVLISAAVLLFCIVGFFALGRRKRSLVAFSLFICGFAYTLIFPPLGLALIFVGGWLMLRAWRIQKYGTANAKGVARNAATRPPRQARQPGPKAPPTPTGHTPPKPSKRYTPKAPTKKRITKPVE